MPSGSPKSTLRPRPAPAVGSATLVSPPGRLCGCHPARVQPERDRRAGWTPWGRAGRGPRISAAAPTVAVPDTTRDGDQLGGLCGRLVGHGCAERAVSVRCPWPGDLPTPGAQGQLGLLGDGAEGGAEGRARLGPDQGAKAGFGARGQALQLLWGGAGIGGRGEGWASEAPELCEPSGALWMLPSLQPLLWPARLPGLMF